MSDYTFEIQKDMQTLGAKIESEELYCGGTMMAIHALLDTIRATRELNRAKRSMARGIRQASYTLNDRIN